uniref:Secreted protein n=1 Tax=Trichogramma kaykai TaxID=54128 RepID=A0ABD2WAI9_9HYME
MQQAAVALWRDRLISLALYSAHAHAKRIRSNSRIRMWNPKYMREETVESVRFYASSAKLTVASQSVLVVRAYGNTTRCYY